MIEEKGKKFRCAIYTRKSSEEGLELEFNSLQAQREACEAYIKSQKHENWQLLPTEYNDGGYSGGNINRPALKQLLSDIEADKVDIIVVYKIDRLTRSLMDFSKIVEILDKHNASFVSITQHFNTTTSMGRLTLNMLLSFAQFEREVTGERIRDKITASKKKGMWMGGKPPLGYIRKEKKIYPDEENAYKIKIIFEKYIELRSTIKLKEYLLDNRISSQNNNALSIGNLDRILKNKAYIGLVGHKGVWYKGEHKGIISEELYNKAQEIMESNRNICNKYEVQKSLLSGKIFDDNGNYMSPSWSTGSNGKRYRYYISQAVIRHEPKRIGKISKVSLKEIEKLTDKALADYIHNKQKIYEYIKDYAINKQEDIFNKLEKYVLTRNIERLIIKRVEIRENEIRISLYSEQVKEVLNAIYENRQEKVLKAEELKNEDSFIVPYRIGIIDNGKKIIIGDIEKEEKYRDKKLINLIIKAYEWHNDILNGKTIKEISQKESVSARYILRLLQISFINPKIIKQIIDGKQARNLTRSKLESLTKLGIEEQEKAII